MYCLKLFQINCCDFRPSGYNCPHIAYKKIHLLFQIVSCYESGSASSSSSFSSSSQWSFRKSIFMLETAVGILWLNWVLMCPSSSGASGCRGRSSSHTVNQVMHVVHGCHVMGCKTSLRTKAWCFLRKSARPIMLHVIATAAASGGLQRW